MSAKQDGGAKQAGGRRTKPEERMPDVTLKIPRQLYLRVGELIKGTGFRSPTEFVIFVLRDLTGTDTEDVEQVRNRLRSLGYLD
jgi:hypothetical protein